MNEGKAYVAADERGVLRVAGTRISLDSVVIGFQQGESPEEIQRNFPALTLEQVYGAITHYLAHRDEVDEYLRQQGEVWERARAESERTPNPVVERLRKLKSEKAGLGR